MMRRNNQFQGWLFYGLAALYGAVLLNSLLLYLLDFGVLPGAYRGSLLFHLFAGSLCLLPLLPFLFIHLRRMPHRANLRAALAGGMVATSLVLTLITGGLLYVKSMADFRFALLLTHVTSVGLTLASFATHLWSRRERVVHFLKGWRPAAPVLRIALLLLMLGVIFLVPQVDKGVAFAAVDLQPGAALPADGRYLHPENLLDGGSCGDEGCHPDVTTQWEQSAHHFASFNNPFYRRSVEGLLEDNAVAKARWCASCHDPLLLLAGDLDTEDPGFMDQHEHALAGITCLACHAVTEVPDATGNGNYVLGHPDYAAQAATPVGTFTGLRRTLIETKPGPHAAAMLGSGILDDQFCTSCHKVAVPPVVNDYRWKRGQNQYDAWYESSFSGKHPRAFYSREKENCISCHMPLTPSDDQGSEGGLIKSHRFAAANTALPYINGHTDQLEAATQALQDNVAGVDIFRFSVAGKTYGPGEMLPPLRAGQSIEIEVVVTNKNAGHALPAGTNDSNEWWLEVCLLEGNAGCILHSGGLNEQEQVDTNAHFFSAVLIDSLGQQLEKRNVHDWRATVVNTTIPSGQSRIVRYRGILPIAIPRPRIFARLQQRKFNDGYTKFTFEDGRLLTAEHLANIARFIDGTKIPLLPVTTVAETVRGGVPPEDLPPLWKRWNNYGIAALQEEQLADASMAFRRVAELADRKDGLTNQARVLLKEGDLTKAEKLLTEAVDRYGMDPQLQYFLGTASFAQGEYDLAVNYWESVVTAYPEDRKLLTDLGEVNYLLGNYSLAGVFLDRALRINPEHPGTLYHALLQAAAAGETAAAEHYRNRYEYHRSEESEAATVAAYLAKNPRLQRERQHPHYHELIPNSSSRIIH